MTDEKMRCPVCGGARLSPETLISGRASNYLADIYFSVKRTVQGWGGREKQKKEKLCIQITRARVCGGCGYVLTFVRRRQLQELQGEWARLESLGLAKGDEA